MKTKTYTVEHLRGVAGVNETAIETEYVEAVSALEAICIVAHDVEGWRIDTALPGYAVIANPDAANASGKWCDYWMATQHNGGSDQ